MKKRPSVKVKVPTGKVELRVVSLMRKTKQDNFIKRGIRNTYTHTGVSYIRAMFRATISLMRTFSPW